jgi:hypothetical protein
MRQTTALFVCTLALALCAVYAPAQAPPPDTLKVDYFANANTGAPDATVRVMNPGTSGGDLCAAIYVLDVNQEMSECCSCFVSPNGLFTLSVNTDLTKNPLTGVILNGGVIKIMSTQKTGATCPKYPIGTTPTAAIRSWATHLQNGSFTITENPSQDATLSLTEQRDLQNGCHAIQLDGSGNGQCTCGTGGGGGT